MKKLITIIIILSTFCSVHAQQSILKNYHKIAIDSSAALKAVYTKYEMALERIPQASTLPDPNISFAYGLSPIETRLGPQQAKISVTQMFPWFGTLNAKEQQAASLAVANYEEYVLHRNKLVYDVSASWYSLYFFAQSIKNMQQQIDILEMLERLANIMFESNQGSMVEVLRFQMAIEELTAKMLLLKDQLKTSQTQFNTLLNRNTSTNVLMPDSLPIPDDRIFNLDSVLINNPQLKILDAEYYAAEYQIEAAKKSGYPSFGLGIDYAFIGNRTDMQIEGSGTDAIMPMLSISIPLYRKKYKAKEKEALLNKERIAYNKTAVQNTLSADFEKAMQDYNDAKRNISLYQSLLKKANKALRILQTAYATSGKSYDQLLEVHNSVLKYQIAYDKSVSDLYKTIAYLEFISVY